VRLERELAWRSPARWARTSRVRQPPHSASAPPALGRPLHGIVFTGTDRPGARRSRSACQCPV